MRRCAQPVRLRMRSQRDSRPRRPGRRGRKANPDQLNRDHACDRHPDNDRDSRRRLVVRRDNTKAVYKSDWEYSGAIELVVWAVPALTVMLLGGIAWIGSHELEPSKPLNSPVKP